MKLTKRDLCIFAAGVAIGTLCLDQWFRFDARKHVTYAYDYNHDGIPDYTVTDSNTFMVASAHDRNFDKEMDSFATYDEGVISVSEDDSDFDGQIDSWSYYTHGVLSESVHELDGQPPTDLRYLYYGGIVAWGACLPNGSTNGARVEFYEKGQLVREHCDRDKDGLLDLTVSYDQFGNLVEETPIDPPVPVQAIKLEGTGSMPTTYWDNFLLDPRRPPDTISNIIVTRK
jgi:hypothetical protein